MRYVYLWSMMAGLVSLNIFGLHILLISICLFFLNIGSENQAKLNIGTEFKIWTESNHTELHPLVVSTRLKIPDYARAVTVVGKHVVQRDSLSSFSVSIFIWSPTRVLLPFSASKKRKVNSSPQLLLHFYLGVRLD